MTNLTIHKKYQVDFSPQQLFDAWISPDMVIPPVSKIEVDPKVGGFLKLTVETPDGNSVMVGEFLNLSRPSQLVYTWEWDNNGEITHITVDFKALADGTEIVIAHTGFQSEESRAMHDSGWDSYVNGVVQTLQAID